jgi:hypothetical protein
MTATMAPARAVRHRRLRAPIHATQDAGSGTPKPPFVMEMKATQDVDQHKPLDNYRPKLSRLKSVAHALAQ